MFAFLSLFFLVNRGEIPTQENAVPNILTHENAVSNINIAYISFGVAFLLLLLCFVVGFWCYRKSHRKRIERLYFISCCYVCLPLVFISFYTRIYATNESALSNP